MHASHTCAHHSPVHLRVFGHRHTRHKARNRAGKGMFWFPIWLTAGSFWMQIVQDFQKHGGLEHVRCINTGDIIVDVWLSRWNQPNVTFPVSRTTTPSLAVNKCSESAGSRLKTARSDETESRCVRITSRQTIRNPKAYDFICFSNERRTLREEIYSFRSVVCRMIIVNYGPVHARPHHWWTLLVHIHWAGLPSNNGSL